MTFQIKKAERQQVKLKIAVQGPSGSGKTLGALGLAFSLTPTQKVCVIDTEHETSSLYSDKFPFDILPLSPPYTSARYQEAMQAAADAGYEVIVIDSITHQWDGEGGILERKAELDKRPGSNSYTNWQSFTPEHTKFLEHILKLPAHVIATMRSKSEYVLTTNDKGKQAPKKIGMAPIQRDGVEFEFTVVFEVQLDHKATAVKDRTGLYADRIVDLLDAGVGEELITWMGKGVPAAAVRGPADNGDGTLTFRCEGCSGPIQKAKINGTDYTISEIITKSKHDFEGKSFCALCLPSLYKAKKVMEQGDMVPILAESIKVAENGKAPEVDPLWATMNGGVLRVSGTATDVWEKGKTLFVKMGDEVLSCFVTRSMAIPLRTAKGQRVILDYALTTDGKYKNITDLKRIGDREYFEGKPMQTEAEMFT